MLQLDHSYALLAHATTDSNLPHDFVNFFFIVLVIGSGNYLGWDSLIETCFLCVIPLYYVEFCNKLCTIKKPIPSDVS
jgi:hypothetical protein